MRTDGLKCVGLSIVGYDEIIQRKGDGKEKAGNNARQYLRVTTEKSAFLGDALNPRPLRINWDPSVPILV